MRVIFTVLLVCLLTPSFAKVRKAKSHLRHRYSRHRIAHSRHGHRYAHHRVAHYRRKAVPSAPRDFLSLQFEGQKGKLPMPVEGSLYCHNTTPQKYPSYSPGIGINIPAFVNAPVHAVFEGIVSNIISVDGTKVVIIRHGEYYTVYNNLSSTAVAKGEHVTTLQPIGIIGEDDDCLTVLKFQIWKASGKKTAMKLDPEKWIAYSPRL